MKENHKIYYLLIYLFIIPLSVLSQNNPSFSLNGTINSTNNLALSATTAGQNPVDLSLFNTSSGANTKMSMRYKWPFLGTWGEEDTYLNGAISVVSSEDIPTGLLWTIRASEVSSTYGQTGTSTGNQTVGTQRKILMGSIWSTSTGWLPFWGASTVTSTLTQILSVTNFADIHPTPNGNYQTFVLTFELDNQY
ncbi:MAG: hypothetical protein BWY72_00153 [Bacteroidetes bacterium ADurb.Bin416]|nr:MAG: hypothetical protein BWY72_00153 [Bacteroidetes bacterium ADurb.Bin416]